MILNRKRGCQAATNITLSKETLKTHTVSRQASKKHMTEDQDFL